MPNKGAYGAVKSLRNIWCRMFLALIGQLHLSWKIDSLGDIERDKTQKIIVRNEIIYNVEVFKVSTSNYLKVHTV